MLEYYYSRCTALHPQPEAAAVKTEQATDFEAGIYGAGPHLRQQMVFLASAGQSHVPQMHFYILGVCKSG